MPCTSIRVQWSKRQSQQTRWRHQRKKRPGVDQQWTRLFIREMAHYKGRLAMSELQTENLRAFRVELRRERQKCGEGAGKKACSGSASRKRIVVVVDLNGAEST